MSKPPRIGVTVLATSGLNGYGVWRKQRPGNRPVDRLLKVLRYGVQRGYWLDWRITLYDEVSK